MLELADRAVAPVVGFIASGGARIDEGTGALGGYGTIFRRHVTLSGPSAADQRDHGDLRRRGRVLPALTDFVVMVEGSRLFLTGPAWSRR